MSKSTPGLLKAIEDFRAEHGSDKEHEGTVGLLDRVEGDVMKRGGHAEPSGYETVGRIEAKGAAERAMPSEANHDGGEGNTHSGKPGAVGFPDKVADMHENSEGSSNPMHRTEPQLSGGNLRATMPGPGERPGVIPDVRRQAAISALEKTPSSGGNLHSVQPQDTSTPPDKRIGDVKAPAAPPSDRNKGAAFEETPAFAKQSLSGDGWAGAKAKAKQMWAKK